MCMTSTNKDYVYDEHPMAGRNIQRHSKQEVVEINKTDKVEKLIKINVACKTNSFNLKKLSLFKKSIFFVG